MNSLQQLRQLCNVRAALVVTLPFLLAWTPWPVALTLLHVPLFVVCALPISLSLYGLQAFITATNFLRPDLPWLSVSLAAAVAIVVVGRLTGRLLDDNEALLRRDGPAVRRVLLGVALLLVGISDLRSMPLWPPLCWAGIYVITGLALPRREPRPTWKERAATCALVGVSTLVALGLGEVGARILFGAPHLGAVVASREYLRTPRPGGYSYYRVHMSQTKSLPIPMTYSEDCIRGERLRPKTPGLVRIMAIGDSFTYGLGVYNGEAYPWQLERILNERAHAERFDVVNAGVGGSGPYQQLRFFLEMVDKVQPDLVIQQLLPSNDIADDLSFEDKYLQSAHPLYFGYRYFMMHGPYGLIRLREELEGRSALFATLWHSCGADWSTLDLGRQFRLVAPLDYPQPGPGMMRPFHIEALLRDWYPELIEGWELNRKHVRMVRDYCAGAGIDYFAFAAPDLAALSDGQWANLPVIQPQLKGQMHLYDREKVARISREFFRDNGIPYADMFRAFKEYPHVDRLYYEFDGHWNLHGCHYAAEVVANALAAWWPERFTPVPGEAAESDQRAPEASEHVWQPESETPLEELP